MGTNLPGESPRPLQPSVTPASPSATAQNHLTDTTDQVVAEGTPLVTNIENSNGILTIY